MDAEQPLELARASQRPRSGSRRRSLVSSGAWSIPWAADLESLLHEPRDAGRIGERDAGRAGARGRPRVRAAEPPGDAEDGRAKPVLDCRRGAASSTTLAKASSKVSGDRPGREPALPQPVADLADRQHGEPGSAIVFTAREQRRIDESGPGRRSTPWYMRIRTLMGTSSAFEMNVL